MNCIDFIMNVLEGGLFPILDIEARNALKVLNVGGDKHHLVMNRRCTYKQIKLIHTHTFMFKRVTNLAVLLERRIRGYNSEQFLYLLYIFQLLCLVIGLGKTEIQLGNRYLGNIAILGAYFLQRISHISFVSKHGNTHTGVKQITGHNYQVSTVREDSTFSLRSISA